MFNRLYHSPGKVGANAACNYWSNLGSAHQVPIMTGWTQAVWNTKFTPYFCTWPALAIEPQTFWSWGQCPIRLVMFYHNLGNEMVICYSTKMNKRVTMLGFKICLSLDHLLLDNISKLATYAKWGRVVKLNSSNMVNSKTLFSLLVLFFPGQDKDWVLTTKERCAFRNMPLLSPFSFLKWSNWGIKWF